MTVFLLLAIVFVVVVLLWFLLLVGAYPGQPQQVNWLAFVAVLVLGLVVFLVGGGVIAVR